MAEIKDLEFTDDQLDTIVHTDFTLDDLLKLETSLRRNIKRKQGSLDGMRRKNDPRVELMFHSENSLSNYRDLHGKLHELIQQFT